MIATDAFICERQLVWSWILRFVFPFAAHNVLDPRSQQANVILCNLKRSIHA